ncbi:MULTISPECIES: biotin--[acetyl-CoA-carboxylase] ligase [unclassified Romboutsia]|uniref:biotin--[acetyl-CoA-carboxylase] ligase n=1 Tax=unclassified Romboutsia TaxID=2626894 RepID=UPI000821099B|nr:MULTISPECIES: biotin--[acetyl-CoA-carboxylase] ligase [unclassified Romboutsia]SCI31189.1 Bifunctional protein BirA [uncultured Clostridium sp.]
MREKVINIILDNDKEFISGEEISKQLGISRSAVWKHIKSLKAEGYDIESINKKGYRLKEKPKDLLSSQNIVHGLDTRFIGKNIIHFETIDSTNTYAKKIASEEIDGTVVISEEQSKGRGRLGRIWDSKAYEGIWMSIILKPNVLPYKAPFITILAGSCIAKALNNLGVTVGIKWPNDIILNGKKLCGILTELSAEIERVNYVILGIGMNIKNLSFPNEIENIATSLYKEGYKVSRVDIVREILCELEKYYTEYIVDGNSKNIIELYKNYSVVLNKKIYIIKNDEKELVECIDINSEGNLVIKKQDGTITEAISGEISIRGEHGYV